MELQLLKEIGLTDSESKVYLALLELGSSSKGPIVDKSGVASSKIYELLDKLIKKGLVSSVLKSNTRYFESASPKRLLDYMREKKEELQKQEDALESLIPQLEMKRSLAGIESETQVFKGVKGAETAFADILDTLNKGDELLVLGFSAVPQNFQKFLLRFHNKRAAKGISLRAFFGRDLVEMMNAINKLPHSHCKPSNTDDEQPVAYLVYADKVLFSIPLDEVWVQITNKGLADSFRKQFETNWNQTTLTHYGFDAVTKKFEEELDIMKEGEEYYVLGASLELGNKKITDWLDNYHKLRVQKNRKVKFLAQYDVYTDIMQRMKNVNDPQMGITQLRRLAPDFDTPFQINLYHGNKVWLVLWQPEMVCIEIISEAAYQNFKTFFDALWNQDSYVLKGLDAVESLFEEMLEQGHCDFIAARGYFVDHRPEYIKDWAKRAKESGFTMRNIVDEEIRGHKITKFSFVDTKYTLQKEFAQLSVFWIFKDKVAISNWIDNEPVVLIIENPQIVQLYKTQFELLWSDK